MSKDLRIVFMGTPDFAVPSLKILVENGFNVVAVVTAPDKPAGRGLKISMSPVKEYAVEQNLTVLQPTNLKDPDFANSLTDLGVNLGVVVAFRMLPEVIWRLPEYGSFNLHASLLPQYRGAAPINHAIINGEKKTGVTTFFLKHIIDTGNIIHQKEETILEADTAGTLYGRLMNIGSELVLKTVQDIAQGEVETHEQVIEGDINEAPKIFRKDCQINWNRATDTIYNFIRGLSPYPGAWCEFKGKTLKIFKARKSSTTGLKPGEFKEIDGNLYIGTAVSAIQVLELQLEGKKRMQAVDFLKGNQL